MHCRRALVLKRQPGLCTRTALSRKRDEEEGERDAVARSRKVLTEKKKGRITQFFDHGYLPFIFAFIRIAYF